MLGFLLKKMVSRLLFPVPVCILLLLSGVALLSFSRRRRSGLALTAAALGLLLALGYGVPGKAVLRRLEWRHAPPAAGWSMAALTADSSKPPWIVVLGSNLSEDPIPPANSRLDPHFLVRVVEGFRLLRQEPRARLLLSLPGRLPVAQKRALADDLCLGLGVAPERIFLLTDALDTVDEARSAAQTVGDAPLVLVTSAAHMPRSMRLFAGAGLAPVACPTDFLTTRPGAPGARHLVSIFPTSENINRSERALYECLGLAWATWRGQTAAPSVAARPVSAVPSLRPQADPANARPADLARRSPPAHGSPHP
jgi:uncharacterized SAM-binding protein YcdF (DUF218 family)